MHELTASDAAARIRSGKLTSLSLVSTRLALIEVREPEVGAWQFIDPDLAIEQAVPPIAARPVAHCTAYRWACS